MKKKNILSPSSADIQFSCAAPDAGSMKTDLFPKVVVEINNNKHIVHV